VFFMPLNFFLSNTKRLARRLLRAPAATGRTGVEYAHDWYDDMYSKTGEYQCRYAESHYYFLWSVIADRVRGSGARGVLEVGCGPGQLAAYLLDQGLEEYHGFDFSPQAVSMARLNAPRGHFEVGDARDSSLYEAVRYDVLICTEVLEHIEDDLSVVTNFGSGRRCLCTVPSFDFPSHVRHFRDANEVAERYGPFFEGLDVMTFESPRSREDRFFLMDGVRGTRGADAPQ
jgi:SAM-dependent methyltransferase